MHVQQHVTLQRTLRDCNRIGLLAKLTQVPKKSAILRYGQHQILRPSAACNLSEYKHCSCLGYKILTINDSQSEPIQLQQPAKCRTPDGPYMMHVTSYLHSTAVAVGARCWCSPRQALIEPAVSGLAMSTKCLLSTTRQMFCR